MNPGTPSDTPSIPIADGCDASFPTAFPLACITRLIGLIRNGGFAGNRVVAIQTVAWIIGCLANVLGNIGGGGVVAAASTPEFETDDEFVDQVNQVLASAGIDPGSEVSVQNTAQLSPEVIMLLLQLATAWLNRRANR